jgi:P27 family predicted phage terminase small subunit
MPSGLTSEGQEEWNWVTGLLRERGVLDSLDQVALQDYLTCWTRLLECERDIQRRGVLVDGDRGKVKNPCCQLSRQYRDHLIAWSRELGLTALARERLTMPPALSAAEDAEWAKWAAL